MWKAAFESDPVGRQAGGVRGYTISRTAEDPNRVVIDLEFESQGEAETFAAKLREMWSARGAELGLESPQARVLEAVERHSY